MNTEPFKKLLEFTSPINECFKSDGKQIYLVGGIVRDVCAGLNDTFNLDLDIYTNKN